MRELKFRVFDIKKKGYAPSKDFYIGAEGKCLCYHPNYEYYASYHSINENFTIEQFTGLYDSEGKEIYEGDILEGKSAMYNDILGKIVFSNSAFKITMPGKYSHSFNNSPLMLLSHLLTRTIIGNINENPELLK